MKRFRKGLAALLATVLILGVGGAAQAVIGVPDDVPASTILYPFFKVNPTRTSSDAQDTLLVLTNTAGATQGPTGLNQSAVAPNIAVHFTIWSIKSQHIYDFSVILTPHDVFSCSLYDLLVGGTGCKNGTTATVAPAPAGVAPQLLVGNQLNGYVTADLVYGPTFLFPGVANYPFAYGNVLVGHLYLVNLVQGSSTGFNAVSIESAQPCYGHPVNPAAPQITANVLGFYRTRCGDSDGLGDQTQCVTTPPAAGVCTRSIAYGDYTERIDGVSGDLAQTGTATILGSPLSLLVRYYSFSGLNARSELWSWRDRTPATSNLNIAVYDDAENFFSVTFAVTNEVSFASTKDIITVGATDGWFRLKYTASQFGSSGYLFTAPGTAAPAASATTNPTIQSVAYSIQFADSTGGGSSATLRWDAAFPAHRQYSDYVNIGE